jgi:hypothetical protein
MVSEAQINPHDQKVSSLVSKNSQILHDRLVGLSALVRVMFKPGLHSPHPSLVKQKSIRYHGLLDKGKGPLLPDAFLFP